MTQLHDINAYSPNFVGPFSINAFLQCLKSHFFQVRFSNRNTSFSRVHYFC